MPVEDARFHPHLVVGLAEAARVRQLQADDEPVVVAHRLAVRADQRVAQPRDGGLAAGGHHQLVGIGAAVVTHGHGLAAPDQLGAREAEVAPAPDRVVGRPAVFVAIPAFHRLDREAVADRERARPSACDPSGESGPDATMSSHGIARPRRCRFSLKPAEVCSDLILAKSPNFTRPTPLPEPELRACRFRSHGCPHCECHCVTRTPDAS